MHFIENYNEGRPFIIASHSQGTTHGIRLIRDVVDKNEELSNRMSVAYLVGMGVLKNEFQNIMPCEKPEEYGCFNSWRTYRKGHEPPPFYEHGEKFAVINPLTWDVDEPYGDKSLHNGAVLRRFNKVFYEILDAESSEGMLWVSRPKFPMSFLLTRKNYHVADYNFFYYNIQENAIDRTNAFLSDMGN